MGAIAFYMPDLSGGGVERMRLSLIAELRARGRDVTLVVQSGRGPLLALLPPDLKLVVLGGSTLTGIPRLIRFLRGTQPEVLVASLDHNNVAALLAKVLSGGATPVVICQHNALSAEAATSWRYRIVPWLYWLLQSRADAILAVSDGVAADLARCAGIPRTRITTIHNPVVDSSFSLREAVPAPHAWLHDRLEPVFVFAGRLSRQKDPLTLLRAFAMLRQRVHARLVFIGEGPLLACLQVEAARLSLGDAVVFAGFQSDPLPWIARADALVLSSRYEGFGNVIVEALACGTPVVATDCPWGPAEILHDERYGLLAKPGDPDSLCQAMQHSLRTAWNRQALRDRGASFSAASCADRHLALFDAIRERRRTVFGLRMSTRTAAETVSLLFAEPAREKIRLVVTPNLDHLRRLRRPDFATAYGSADLCCPDGFPVLLYARLRGMAMRGRVTGCEIFHRIATHPHLATQRLFLIVESAATADAVISWATRLNLHTQIGVAVAPPALASGSEAERSLVDAARAHAPTMLIVTLGAPCSELFVHRNRAALPPCWALCVGQAVRVELGLTRRAPEPWQAAGLEWLWRLRQEPARLAGRYARALAWFPVAILKDLLSKSHAAPPPGQSAGTAS